MGASLPRGSLLEGPIRDCLCLWLHYIRDLQKRQPLPLVSLLEKTATDLLCLKFPRETLVSLTAPC